MIMFFLKTMILHHQAAIDMSKLINKSSTNDEILAIARNIIFNQTNEIYFMKKFYIETKYSINEKNTTNKPLKNIFQSEYSSIFKKLNCNESHFNFNHHNMSDSQYVKHMISHHDTALKLSKLAIISTQNSRILVLAHNINLNQSKEIFELYFLEKSLKHHWRNSFKPFIPLHI